jgi:hypothetical protein
LELGAGIEIWCKEGGRRDADLHPLGGVIVEVFPGSSGMDDMGEHYDRPATYTVFDLGAASGRAWHRIERPEIDMDNIAQASNLARVVRRLAGELAGLKQARRPSNRLTSREVDLGRYIGVLTKIEAAGPVALSRLASRDEDDPDSF